MFYIPLHSTREPRWVDNPQDVVRLRHNDGFLWNPNGITRYHVVPDAIKRVPFDASFFALPGEQRKLVRPFELLSLDHDEFANMFHTMRTRQGLFLVHDSAATPVDVPHQSRLPTLFRSCNPWTGYFVQHSKRSHENLIRRRT